MAPMTPLQRLVDLLISPLAHQSAPVAAAVLPVAQPTDLLSSTCGFPDGIGTDFSVSM